MREVSALAKEGSVDKQQCLYLSTNTICASQSWEAGSAQSSQVIDACGLKLEAGEAGPEVQMPQLHSFSSCVLVLCGQAA